MPRYVEAVIRHFHYNAPFCPEYQPAAHVPPIYSATIQWPIPLNKSPRLDLKGFHYVQQADR